MNLTRDDFHTMIIYDDFRCPLSRQESYNGLMLAFYDEVESLYDWFKEFKRDRTNLASDPPEGHFSTATTEGSISSVQLMVEIDKRVTY
ncbi:hypothetical protein EVAR_5045_1 [Eumeta japonica]|uniref:Mariner Mos1 transposase n=1 Tax=Eumeta variegata TaxID=151549 RepID=A0A4C1SUZ0_EUMVA|nr:hypothetical protein EVAR_5045_1 [Eumeta japonica]